MSRLTRDCAERKTTADFVHLSLTQVRQGDGSVLHARDPQQRRGSRALVLPTDFRREAGSPHRSRRLHGYATRSSSRSSSTESLACARTDDGTPIALKVSIDEKTGSAIWDFEGTGLEGYSNLNAPTAVANSAMIYCLRTLIGTDMPLNAGVLAPVDLRVPEGTILKPSKYAAVSSGNTETSQRWVTLASTRAFE